MPNGLHRHPDRLRQFGSVASSAGIARLRSDERLVNLISEGGKSEFWQARYRAAAANVRYMHDGMVAPGIDDVIAAVAA